MLALLALLVLLAGAATALLLTMPTISRVEPSRITSDATPTITLRIAHPAGIDPSQIDASIDGAGIEPERITVLGDGARIQIAAPRLDDGRHDVRVTVHDAGVVHRTLRERWSFTVDTTPPRARIVAPVGADAGDSAYVAAGVATVTRGTLRMTASVEPGARITVVSTSPRARSVSAAGADEPRRTIDVPLPQGSQTLTLAATDAAGNVTERTLDVLVDTTGPALLLRAPRVLRSATLELPVTARDALGVQLRVRLDGRELEDAATPQDVREAPFAAASADAASEAPDVADGGDGGDDSATPPTADGAAPMPVVAMTSDENPEAAAAADDDALPVSGTWKLQAEDRVLEGRHVLEVEGTDSLGRRTRVTRTIFVDSTEQLSDASGLRAGARGTDVLQLLDALVKQDVVAPAALAADRRTRTYGAQTRAAVQTYQQRRGMDADGIAGPDTIAGLTLKIVVDRSANTLTLYRMGAVVKTWGVATGSPQYPTPAGDFSIQSMQQNPTWTPPDSAWAKDAEPIAPGPDNPLGTRWMAVNGTVGIHGTNNPASIGYSVSHGCIRMAIPDVEALFDMVAIGTPVSIV